MRSIFISYRRDDAKLMVDRLVDRLRAVFGNEVVFRDVDSIQIGQDFRTQITESMRDAKVCLVVIGPQWITPATDGQRRIDNPADPLRVEIESAFRLKVPIIPILVQNTLMPREQELPESINQLVYYNAVRLREDPDFQHDFDQLVTAITHYIPKPANKLPRPGIRRFPWLSGILGAILVIVLATILIVKPALPFLPTSHGQTNGGGTPNGTTAKSTTPKLTSLIPAGWQEQDDPLVDNSKGNHWDETSYLLYSCTLGTSGYAIAGSILGFCLAKTATEFADFAVQVDVQTLGGGAGIVIHASDNGGYYYFLDNNDSTHITANFVAFDTNHHLTTLKIVSLSDQRIPFLQGKTDTNTLGVVVRGNTYTLFVNGVEAAQVTDSTFPQGFLGLGEGYDNGRDYGNAIMKNLKLWTPAA